MESNAAFLRRTVASGFAMTVAVVASGFADARADEKSAVASMFDPYLTMPQQASPTFTRPDVQAPPALPDKAAAPASHPSEATGTVASGAGQQPLRRREARKVGTGRASWYQHPGRTASGETFKPDALTAAHRSLPFGSHIKVVNQGNGRSVVVRINDRTNQRTAARRPYVIDLSRGSARALGITSLAQVALFKVD